MTTTYTVIGLNPDSDWGHGMREATFVDFIAALTPAHAAHICRGMRCVELDASPEDVEILAVFVGQHPDEYDPSVEMDSNYMNTLDMEISGLLVDV